MVIVLTYVNVSASLLSNTGTLSFYLVAIANASSMFGRYAAGLLSDSIGEGLPTLRSRL
jgi:hypothetical protein